MYRAALPRTKLESPRPDAVFTRLDRGRRAPHRGRRLARHGRPQLGLRARRALGLAARGRLRRGAGSVARRRARARPRRASGDAVGRQRRARPRRAALPARRAAAAGSRSTRGWASWRRSMPGARRGRARGGVGAGRSDRGVRVLRPGRRRAQRAELLDRRGAAARRAARAAGARARDRARGRLRARAAGRRRPTASPSSRSRTRSRPSPRSPRAPGPRPPRSCTGGTRTARRRRGRRS